MVDKINDKKWQIIKDGLMEYPSFLKSTHIKSFEILSMIIFGKFELKNPCRIKEYKCSCNWCTIMLLTFADAILG